MATQNAQPETGATLEEKIAARIHDVNVKLDAFEAKAKAVRTAAEATAIKGLKRARAEIDATLVALQQSLDEFRKKYTSALRQGPVDAGTDIGDLSPSAHPVVSRLFERVERNPT
jgi:predicted DNA-binding protein (UPF0278 family)